MSVLVTRKAPGFTAPAVLPDESIVTDYSLASLRGSYVALFFYPLDFTFVCPTEILAFDTKVDALRERGCEVVGVSVDSQFTHLAWRRTDVAEGGIGPIRFPLVADLTKSISRDYGVLTDDGVALRATFLIDQEGVVRHQAVNDLALGRQVDETVRVLEALRHAEETGRVCPAGWEPGQESMEPTPGGVKKYLKVFVDAPR